MPAAVFVPVRWGVVLVGTLAAAAAAAQVADAVSTYIALARHPAELVEGTPLVAAAIDAVGVGPAMVARAAAGLAWVAAVTQIADSGWVVRKPRDSRAATVVYLGVPWWRRFDLRRAAAVCALAVITAIHSAAAVTNVGDILWAVQLR